MPNLLIIYPQDPSIVFLESILVHLKSIIKMDIVLIRPDFSENSYNATRTFLHNADPTIPILFMGHGHSTHIYGGSDSTHEKRSLINIEEGKEIFNKRKFICLACRSSQYIASLSEIIDAGIGFGEIPTDWDEIVAAMDADCNSYKNVTEESILYFREKLLKIFANSIAETYLSRYNFYEFRSRLRLRINKEISQLLFSKRSDKYALGEMFYFFKEDMFVYANSSVSLF